MAEPSGGTDLCQHPLQVFQELSHRRAEWPTISHRVCPGGHSHLPHPHHGEPCSAEDQEWGWQLLMYRTDWTFWIRTLFSHMLRTAYLNIDCCCTFISSQQRRDSSLTTPILNNQKQMQPFKRLSWFRALVIFCVVKMNDAVQWQTSRGPNCDVIGNPSTVSHYCF